MIAAIILAAGNSTRIKNLSGNKVTLLYNNKPLIGLAVESLAGIADPIIVVVGAYKDSVKQVLKEYKVTYIEQKKRLGTAHAVKQTLPFLKKINPDQVIIGYGDHMMLVDIHTINKMIKYHQQNSLDLSFISTRVNNPFGLGRVIKDKNNYVAGIIEQKDTTMQQKNISIINTGIYFINFKFLSKYIGKIKKNQKSGEYYLTDLIKIAHDNNYLVKDFCVKYDKIGMGVNTLEHLNQLKTIKVTKQQEIII